MAEIPPRFDAPVPEPGPEGRTPQWIRTVRRVRKMNAVREIQLNITLLIDQENHSLRASFLLKMDVCKEFVDEVWLSTCLLL